MQPAVLRLAFLVALLSAPVSPALGQHVLSADPSPRYEFRGAWIATVVNLDWPVRGAPTNSQKAELKTLFDRLHGAGINAVFFQVRTEADALYDSPYEPWSYWLTGTQGKAPNPSFDPLAEAVTLAHERGMELHAWVNPYRAERVVGSYALDTTHVVVRHPDWILTIGSIRILDPGLPQVRDHVTRIVSDIARRYDVDGIHFDDYFYPYPPNQITTQDRPTFNAYRRGYSTEQIGAWRRDNINLFVAQVADSLRSIKPHVKFGISPFGIWKNGVPAGITGLDAYSVLFADALAWVAEESIDYLVPQLYWPFGGGQDYGKLAPWWASVTGDRHLYTGHGLYRSDPATFSGTLFAAGEVPRQVRFNRSRSDIEGSAFFRARNITHLSSKGFADSLRTNLYARPAITPPMDWKDQTAPESPGPTTLVSNDDGSVTLSWKAVPPDEQTTWRRYAVYRVQSAEKPNPIFAVLNEGALLAVALDTALVDIPYVSDEPYWYFVTALSRNAIESQPTDPVSVEGRVVATEVDAVPVAQVLLPAYPNPFDYRTTIPFVLSDPQTVSLSIYDALGRTVARLAGDEWRTAGAHEVVWDGTDGSGRSVASGTYLVVLETDVQRWTRLLVKIR